MIKKLKASISRSVKSKRIHVFFLFLALAFTILIFTKLSKEYTNTVTFDITKKNVPPEHVILNDSNSKLKITLKTHGFKWLRYYFFKPNITIDFDKDVDNIKSTYVWRKSKAYLYESAQFGEQVKLLNITPDTLLFRYDVNLIKQVPVILKSNINYSQGFDIYGDYSVKPDSVEIIGPHILVSEINYIETEQVELSEVKSNIETHIKLKLPQHDNNLMFSNETVLLSARVKKFTEGNLKVPVTITNVPKNTRLKYFPKAVNVTFYTSLEDFNSILSEDFMVTCDYSKVIEGQSFLRPELFKFPEVVKNAKVNQQRIEFIILK